MKHREPERPPEWTRTQMVLFYIFVGFFAILGVYRVALEFIL